MAQAESNEKVFVCRRSLNSFLLTRSTSLPGGRGETGSWWPWPSWRNELTAAPLLTSRAGRVQGGQGAALVSEHSSTWVLLLADPSSGQNAGSSSLSATLNVTSLQGSLPKGLFGLEILPQNEIWVNCKYTAKHWNDLNNIDAVITVVSYVRSINLQLQCF